MYTKKPSMVAFYNIGPGNVKKKKDNWGSIQYRRTNNTYRAEIKNRIKGALSPGARMGRLHPILGSLPSVLWRCWLGGRKGIRPIKTEWWGAGMVVCLERGADWHMAQLMPLPLLLRSIIMCVSTRSNRIRCRREQVSEQLLNGTSAHCRLLSATKLEVTKSSES